ncbi:MAG TPA: hypothetical protein V6D11_09755 [Waterburya sp.]|jgi:Ni/Co efflux regulator RcnB
MNKLAGALVLALVVAAPLAISTSAVQAATVKSHPQMTQSAKKTHHTTKHHRTNHTTTRNHK